MKTNKLEKEMRKQHHKNELHRFCKDIKSLVNAGYNPQEAYNYVKQKYRKESGK